MTMHEYHEKPGKKKPKRGEKLMKAMMKEQMGKRAPMMPMKRGM